MNYLTCLKKDEVALLQGDIPRPEAGGLIVRMTACGVCGTDTMKVFGDSPRPQKLGHEVVGVVHEAASPQVRLKPGDRVALAHHVPDSTSHYSLHGSETMDALFKSTNIDPGGFSQYIGVPALHAASTVFRIPDHVPDRRAVFMEPLACCIRATDRMALRPGASALVVGVGAVGMLFLPLLRALGVEPFAADLRVARMALARRWGASFAAVTDTEDVPALCRSATEGRGVDAVILTIVNDATLALALAAVRDGGAIMLFGGKPGTVSPLPMWDIWRREINLLTSYSATPDGLGRAMDYLALPDFAGLEELISHAFPLDKGQTAFEMAHQGKASKVIITG